MEHKTCPDCRFTNGAEFMPVRTGLFDSNDITLSEETGRELLAWRNSGTDPKEEQYNV